MSQNPDIFAVTGVPSPPAPPRQARRVDDPEFLARLDAIVSECVDPDSPNGAYVRDLVMTSLKLATDGRNPGEMKLLATALKELRYAYNVFGQYPDSYKISIFGSARTPPEHPDYQSAVEFSRLVAQRGWSVITGAGDGIMKAGHEGPGRESSFGLSIRLPFETNANSVIKGDSKLISFRYFFTRKLMFVSQSEAVAVYPGGFGTQDEAFEALTLVQTGKTAMIPIVLLEHPGGEYWKHWDDYVRRSLLDNGMVSPEDLNLYYIAPSPADAVEHVCRFYKNYHSARYVRNNLVIRLRRPLRPGDVERLGTEFAALLRAGAIVQRGPYEVEEEFLDLPRIAFTHTRRNIGLIRRLIDRINEFEPADDAGLHPSEIY